MRTPRQEPFWLQPPLFEPDWICAELTLHYHRREDGVQASLLLRDGETGEWLDCVISRAVHDSEVRRHAHDLLDKMIDRLQQFQETFPDL